MHLRLALIALLTAAYAFSATVSIGTFQWTPIGETNLGYFKVVAKSGTVSDDVLDEIRLENLRLVLELQSPINPLSFAYRAFTLYPDWTSADAVTPAAEPGDSDLAGFPRVTLDPVSPPDHARFSRKFMNPIPGDGDVRITKAYLDYSGTAIVPQASWTLNNGSEFIPNAGVFFVELNNGGALFPYSGGGFNINLLVEGETVVPEPSTIAMAIGGIAVLIARRRFVR